MEENNIKIIVDALVEKKAQNIMSIDLHDMTTIADAFIIASGNSVTQTKALYDYVLEKCEENDLDVVASEGYDAARWIVIDVDGLMIHIFHRDDREFYNIERLWVDGDNAINYKLIYN